MNDQLFPYFSPVGKLWPRFHQEATTEISWQPVSQHEPFSPILAIQVHDWLSSYFGGRFSQPIFPLAPSGTFFQKRVWAELSKIPVGSVLTYGELAAKLQTHARAVGQAVGANPIPILIPCHRVVAARGLGGYSGMGGLDTKRWLLDLEGCSQPSGALFTRVGPVANHTVGCHG